jgi:membrane associated rhomboid family serine protease
MDLFRPEFENRPLFRVNGLPVWLSTALVVLHSVMLIAIATTGGKVMEYLMLIAGTPYGAEGPVWPSWWQWGTYFLANSPSAWFLLDMYFLWVFGRELESTFGRRFFAQLYFMLVALGSVVTAGALLTGLSEQAFLAGPGTIHFCLFMAIAFLHPNAPLMILHVPIKFLAAALLAVNLLRHIQLRYWLGCVVLLASVAAVYILMRRAGLGPRFSRLTEAVSNSLPRPRRRQPEKLPYKPKVVPRLEVRDDRRAVEKVDAILEKISRSGLDSLTPEERRELERASAELKRQDD